MQGSESFGEEVHLCEAMKIADRDHLPSEAVFWLVRQMNEEAVSRSQTGHSSVGHGDTGACVS